MITRTRGIPGTDFPCRDRGSTTESGDSLLRQQDNLSARYKIHPGKEAAR
jgi:hypothetical protein